MLYRIVANKYVLYTSTLGLVQLNKAIGEKIDKIMDKVDNMIEGVEPQIEEDTYDVEAEYATKDVEKESPDSLYIGAKIIKARPMTYLEFHGDMDREDEPGYRVEYPDGYVSWSPKDVFETAYRKITDKEMLIIVNS